MLLSGHERTTAAAEMEWQRVKNYIVFLHAGRPNLFQYELVLILVIHWYLLGSLSLADWNIRRLGDVGSMPNTGHHCCCSYRWCTIIDDSGYSEEQTEKGSGPLPHSYSAPHIEDVVIVVALEEEG